MNDDGLNNLRSTTHKFGLPLSAIGSHERLLKENDLLKKALHGARADLIHIAKYAPVPKMCQKIARNALDDIKTILGETP